MRANLLAVLVIAGGALAAYSNTFHAPFTFDDVSSINDNPTIRHLWPPGEALSPPGGWGFTVSGRPVLNYSLAVNYALSGFDPWSYHALNLAIHLLAGLTLFGLVRRTFARPPLAARFGEKAWPLALAVAAVWTLHPLQTEAVTYVVQRCESLMGLFFLLTLYGFVRAVDSPHPRGWWTVSVVACLLGVGTKEIAALAPLLVFLYDRTFVSGSFAEAWRRHRWGHLSLVATWLPLLWLLASTGGDRGGTFHFADGAMWMGHGLTQFEAVTRYIGLAFWPHPLVFDYGLIAPPALPAALRWALPIIALVAATLWALWRRPVIGFLGAWFFVILAPTSTLPATLQIIVEHRMYLPLAAVLALVFGAAATWFGPRAATVIGAGLALVAGGLTYQRNAVYRTEQALWEDTLTKRPDNARALNNLGLAYYHLGRIDDAIALYEKSRRLDPTMANTHYNLGLALMNSGRAAEAMGPFEEAVRILPYYFNAHLNLGVILLQLGRESEALPHFAEALRFDPTPAEVYFRHGAALAELGRWNEALEQFNAALRLTPDWPDVHYNLGLVLAALGRPAEAIPHYAEAVRLNPEHANAQLNLGIALGQAGKLPEAIGHLEQAVRLRPDDARAHYNAGYAQLMAGHSQEARAHFESALKIQPDYAAARDMLNRLRGMNQPP
jgi:protein O-mannosyl-transferase